MNLNNQLELSFQEELKEALQKRGRKIQINPELKDKVINQISLIKEGKKIKTRVLTVILAATMLISTSALATQFLLADQFYGSFENLKKHLIAATLEEYMHFNAKLSEAKGELGEKEYKEFTQLIHVVTDAKLKYANQYGSIDYDQLPPEKVIEIKKAFMAVQPYFDKLNGDKSSKEVLSPEEYEKYIEALMTHEKVMAKSGINPSEGPLDVNKIPKELQDDYKNALDFIDYVTLKQQQ